MYNIGDKVIIKNNLKRGTYYGTIGITNMHLKLCGQESTIMKFDNGYRLDLDNGETRWAWDMLELIKENKEGDVKMKELTNLNLKLDDNKRVNKNNLKLEDLNYTLYSEGDNTYLQLGGKYVNKKVEYIVNIPRICLNKMELIKTEYLKEYSRFNSMSGIDYTISFDLESQDKIIIEAREIEKEMTKEQIEKELGYKIKIV
jgi:hypothetical protein